MRINAPHKDAKEVLSLGSMGRVRLRLYDDDKAVVTVKPGGPGGVKRMRIASWVRIFTGSHSEAERLAAAIAPVIDGYARGCGIVKPSCQMENADGR